MQNTLNVETRIVDENAPWLVLIHGLFGSLDNLAVVRRHFESTYNILNVDLPDHGKSPKLATFSFELWVSMLVSTLTEHQIEQCILLGHSLGGKLAMQTALAYPEKLNGLIVADIAPVKYPSRHKQVFDGINNVKLNEIDSRNDADQQLARFIPEKGVRQFLMKSLFQASANNWQWRFNVKNLIKHYEAICDWPQSNQSFNGPTLFIKGGLSDYLSMEHQNQVVKHFPQATAKVVQGAGHWLHAEKPQAFNRSVEIFLKQID